MTAYKNMFYDKTVNKIVSIDLTTDDILYEQEGTSTTSLAEEYDITHGYNKNKGYKSSPFIEAPIVFELGIRGNPRNQQDVTDTMQSDADIVSGYRDYTNALNWLANNIMLNQPLDVQTTSRKGRFRNTITGGMVTTYQSVHRGLDLKHKLLKRVGGFEDDLNSYNILPNIYDFGETCHGNLGLYDRWLTDSGKRGRDPESLAKKYDLFVGGIGNYDLANSNYTRYILNQEIYNILEDLEENYIPTIEIEQRRRKTENYIETYKEGLRYKGLDEGSRYNAFFLAILVEHTKNHYIEDYV